MGAFLDTPNTAKETEDYTDKKNGLVAGVSCMQGWRIDMEDAHSVQLGVEGHEDWSWFAVYDGHGGSLVAQKSAEQLLKCITSQPTYAAVKTPDELQAVIKSGFLLHDSNLRELPEMTNGVDHSGSTAITCMVLPQHYVVGNCGDSRIVLSRGVGNAVWGSEDHKPTNAGEKARIEAAGGTVSMKRVNGDLAVSRSLGDFLYKHRADLPDVEQQVSAEPEMTVLDRKSGDDYLILCCDGIWDVMTNEEVVEFVRNKVLKGETRLGKVAEELMDLCLQKNSRDNMSVLIVQLPGATQPSDDVVKKYRAAMDEKTKAEGAAGAGGGGASIGGGAAAGGGAGATAAP